jgi:hypothetical protein
MVSIQSNSIISHFELPLFNLIGSSRNDGIKNAKEVLGAIQIIRDTFLAYFSPPPPPPPTVWRNKFHFTENSFFKTFVDTVTTPPPPLECAVYYLNGPLRTARTSRRAVNLEQLLWGSVLTLALRRPTISYASFTTYLLAPKVLCTAKKCRFTKYIAFNNQYHL